MKSQTSEKIEWTLLELGELLEDEDARVYFERTKKHLALHPIYLGDLQRGVNEILSSTLNTYDVELKGFMLAYKNLKLLTSLANIFNESYFVHIDIEADFYLFRPEVGCSLKGIVNKKGLDYVVVLVHKTFTISIPKPDNIEEWVGDLVDIGQEVRCYMTHIDKKVKIPFICATLNSDYMQGCRLLETNNISNIDTVIDSNTNNSEIIDKSNLPEEFSERERKKSLKKHINKFPETYSEVGFKSEKKARPNLDNSSSDYDISIKIKSEDKKHHKSTKSNISNIDYSLNENMETNSVLKKRKKNKIKTLSESESETHIKVKVEKPDLLNRSDNENWNNQLSFNDNIIADNYVNEQTKLHKGVKREHSTDTILEPKKKKKKHAKRSKDSDPESVSVTENESAIDMINISNIKLEDDYENKPVSDTTFSWDNTNVSVTHKKHKKSKKSLMTISDSEQESKIKIKIERPDPIIDKIIAETSGNQIRNSEDQEIQGLNKNIKICNHIKIEDSDTYSHI